MMSEELNSILFKVIPNAWIPHRAKVGTTINRVFESGTVQGIWKCDFLAVVLWARNCRILNGRSKDTVPRVGVREQRG